MSNSPTFKDVGLSRWLTRENNLPPPSAAKANEGGNPAPCSRAPLEPPTRPLRAGGFL